VKGITKDEEVVVQPWCFHTFGSQLLDGDVEKSVVVEAIKKFDIDTNKLNPLYA